MISSCTSPTDRPLWRSRRDSDSGRPTDRPLPRAARRKIGVGAVRPTDPSGGAPRSLLSRYSALWYSVSWTISRCAQRGKNWGWGLPTDRPDSCTYTGSLGPTDRPICISQTPGPESDRLIIYRIYTHFQFVSFEPPFNPFVRPTRGIAMSERPIVATVHALARPL